MPGNVPMPRPLRSTTSWISHVGYAAAIRKNALAFRTYLEAGGGPTDESIAELAEAREALAVRLNQSEALAVGLNQPEALATRRPDPVSIAFDLVWVRYGRLLTAANAYHRARLDPKSSTQLISEDGGAALTPERPLLPGIRSLEEQLSDFATATRQFAWASRADVTDAQASERPT